MKPLADLGTRDRAVLLALQGLVVGFPLFLGGRHPIGQVVGCAVVLALLAVTVGERWRRGGAPHAPGVAALAAFVTLALATIAPLPPKLLAMLSPATARLYAEMLPGWPDAGGWSPWRPLVIDPYGVWEQLVGFSVGLGAFAVIVAYPWRGPEGEDARAGIFERLLLTLFGSGVLLAVLGLVQQVAGNGRILWISAEATTSGRASGPFFNPNHFAAGLEMVIPAAAAYCVILLRQLHRRLLRTAGGGRGTGVRAKRAWMGAVIVHQQRLWGPFLAVTAVLLMVAAHRASDSRGGMAALLAGLAVAGVGMAASAGPKSERAGGRRLLAALVALALVLASAKSVARWASAESDVLVDGAAFAVDPSLASRLAVAAEGRGIVRDHPLFGTGLGSWLHAFRPYQAPPVEGTWDHAHNDYLELAAETGLAGVLVVLLFAIGVAASARSDKPASRAAGGVRIRRPAALELPAWRAVFEERSFLRWGLAGGVVAILVHSLVDFGLRMPANLLALMVVLGLLALSGRPQPPGRSWATPLLLVLLIVAAGPPVANGVLVMGGRTPIAPRDQRNRADLLLAERGEAGRPEALALARQAVDGSPADREAHEVLASILGPGAEGEGALRRALALDPWASEVRDGLALLLWARGERTAGAAELEESMFRLPYLRAHVYLAADRDTIEPKPAADAQAVIRALTAGDTLTLRLAALETDLVDAIERGLRRVLRENRPAADQVAISEDLVTLLEARERWGEAAAALRAEAERNDDGSAYLARASRAYLKTRDYAAAEESLLAAVTLAPERGILYRTLALDIYAARGDFTTADTVLQAGERNALDMKPIYEGVTELLARRVSTQGRDFVGPRTPPPVRDDQALP